MFCKLFSRAFVSKTQRRFDRQENDIAELEETSGIDILIRTLEITALALSRRSGYVLTTFPDKLVLVRTGSICLPQ